VTKQLLTDLRSGNTWFAAPDGPGEDGAGLVVSGQDL
jgi:hypothetical protein